MQKRSFNMRITTELERLAAPVSTRDHFQGQSNAPLTLVEYGDFECPYCGTAHRVVKAIQEKLGERLRFVYRHFPLTQRHPNAENAAQAAEAAGARGDFWPMHDLLFEHQEALADEDLAEYAASLGLDGAEILAEIELGTYATRVREDFSGGIKSGVNGAPTFFINDVLYNGESDLQSMLVALAEAEHRE